MDLNEVEKVVLLKAAVLAVSMWEEAVQDLGGTSRTDQDQVDGLDIQMDLAVLQDLISKIR